MTRGLVLGKFMPPHAGHLHLVQVAQSLSERLTVLVATHPEEPMDGALRHRWMQELCPGCDVVHVHRDLPQLPHEHPRFWEIWVQVVTEAMGGRPDRVFAGESYGDTLAQKLGAAFIPVPRTEGLAISGTEVRAHPRRHWHMIPPPVRSHYATRVRVVGPESSGKTTLSRALAERFDGTWVAEFARGYLEARFGQLVPADLPIIARGQAASEDHLARLAGPLLITDTDPLLTSLWSEALYGETPPAISQAATHRRYDLTLLMAPHDTWRADPVRYMPAPNERERFFERCRVAYPEAIVLSGSWNERSDRAIAALQELEDAHA